MAIKFVHAADLHLDSPFLGLGEVDNDIAELLRKATFQAFDNIVDLCIKRQVDFLLVAGDVYDGADRSLQAQLAFRKGLRRLSEAGIKSFIVHGNHDPLDGWSSSLVWPPGSHFFAGAEPQSVTFERDGVACAMIHGISFPHRDVRTNLVSLFKRQPLPLVHIGLLHCNVGTNTGHEPYAPCTPEDLVNAGMDYWALGHIHARGVCYEGNPTAVYAGNPQGRHVNESGPKGCYLVQVGETNEVRAEFVAVDAVRWERHRVNIEQLNSEEELLGALENSLLSAQESADGRPCLCRLTLLGAGRLHATLRRANYGQHLVAQLREIGRELDPFVWVDALEIETRPPVDIELRRQSQDILGDCLRLIAEYRDDPRRRDKLRDQIRILFEDRQCLGSLGMPEGDDLLALLADAEALCLDKLYEEDS